MQHAVDLHRRHRGTLQRRQKDAAQRIAERRAEAALQRLGDHRRHLAALTARLDFELARTDEFLPVLLIYVHAIPWISRMSRKMLSGLGLFYWAPSWETHY